jgi:hypothetical protein
MPGISRFGDRTAGGHAAFRCARCGELAGVVKVARAGAAVDMGPPLGLEIQDRDGVVVDYFLGTAWHAIGGGTLDAVQAAIDQGDLDPVALRGIDPELAPFYCPDCELNYCADDWAREVVFDEGFYDCTRGTCPHGHVHTIDD